MKPSNGALIIIIEVSRQLTNRDAGAEILSTINCVPTTISSHESRLQRLCADELYQLCCGLAAALTAGTSAATRT